MDANNNFQNTEHQAVFKKPFKFKNDENGILLKIHHTEKYDDEIKRLPFNQVCFSAFSEKAVAINSRGNIFVFDLIAGQFWNLSNTDEECTFVLFERGSDKNIVIGTKGGLICILDTDNGNILRQIQAFTTEVTHISYAPISMEKIMLCSSATDAILCYLGDELKYHVILSVSSIKTNLIDLFIKQIEFCENSKACPNIQICALLNDDSVYIWQHSNSSQQLSGLRSFQLVKHIHPMEYRDRFLENNHAQEIVVNKEFIDSGANALFNISELITSVCFSSDGRRMFLTTIDSYLMVFQTCDWSLILVFRTKQIIAIDCKFISFLDQHNLKRTHSALSIITRCNILILLKCDAENRICIKGEIPKSLGLKQQIISKDNRKLATVLENGKIYIYDLNILLRNLMADEVSTDANRLQMTKEYDDQMQMVNRKLMDILPRSRLLLILKEYKEFPEKYRHIIWKALLQVPDNTAAFTELVRKGAHAYAREYKEQFPIRDQNALRTLIAISSCLAHWCPIFGAKFEGDDHFLPTFIFPFIKILGNNLLLAFEAIATILLNQCQLWFEFSPIEPINYFGMIQNILNQFEPSLLAFYSQRNVSAKIYAWKLCRTAFTEVLNEVQWLQLWDHIISNPSYFLLFAIVAYNIIQKPVIERLPNTESVEAFFDEQNNIDMRTFIDTIYYLMNECPEHLHPKQYMYAFVPLQKDHYQKFTTYPKKMFNRRMDCVERMKVENKRLNEKYTQLEKLEQIIMDQLAQGLREDEHQKRLQQVESAYEEILLCELERIANQRKHLILLERQINDREKALLIAQHENDMEKKCSQREDALQSHLRNLERDKIIEEVELMSAEENIRKRELDAAMKRVNLEHIQSKNEKLEKYRNRIVNKLEKEKFKWRKTIEKFSSSRPTSDAEKSGIKNIERSSSSRPNIEALEKATSRLEEAVAKFLK